MKQSFFQYLHNNTNLSDNSIEAYVMDIEIFFNYLESKGITLDKISTSYILSYLYTLQNSNIKSSTLNRKMSSLKKFLGFMKYKNPEFNFDISFKSIDVNPNSMYLSVRDFDEFVGCIDSDSGIGIRDRTIIELLVATGIKTQELIELKLDNFNFILNTLNIISGENSRTIPLTERSIFWLSKYLNDYKPSVNDYFFHTTHNNKLTRQSLHKIFSKYNCTYRKCNVTAQLIRDSMAYWLANCGVDAYSLQKILGINDIKSVEKYYDCHDENKMRMKLLEFHPLRGQNHENV